MANFLQLASILLTIFVIATNSAPDFQASGQKLIKIKEHEKTKNILIVKNSQISSSDNDHHGSSSEESTTASSSEESSSTQSSSDEGAGHTHGRSVDGGCVNPHPEPIEIFAKFAKELVTHRMFVLTTSRHYADQASLLLTGKPISENNPAKACIRVIWENSRRRLQGFGQKSILPCSYEEVTDITCHKEDNKDSNIRITYVWSDGRSNVLAIMCGNGKGSWAILSNSREISRDNRDAMLQVVENYGFDPEDNVDFSWTEDDCPSTVGSQYQEGPCVETDDDLETVAANKKEAVLRILHGGVYTAYSSLANAYATGMFIRGQPLKGKKDLEQACVRDVWSRTGEIERKGFGDQDNFLECDISDFTRITCVPNEEKADAGENEVIYNMHVHPVWTDGKKYVLTYNCLSTHLKTWSLYSTSKEPLDHDTKTYIMSKIADYGFDPTKAYEPNYEHCHN